MANLIVNGSFEIASSGTTAPAGGSYRLLVPGNTTIMGWSIIGGNGQNGLGWFSNGAYSLTTPYGTDFATLTGNTALQPEYGVEQLINTTPGATYALTFDIGTSTSYPDTSGAGVSVTAGNQTSIINGITATSAVTWTPEEVDFTATGTVSPIIIQGDAPGEYIGLDNVSVSTTANPSPPANLIADGNFGQASPGAALPTGAGETLASGSTIIAGWTVTGTTALGWLANDSANTQSSPFGVYFLNLAENTAGYDGVTQTIATTPGQAYELTFEVGTDSTTIGTLPSGDGLALASGSDQMPGWTVFGGLPSDGLAWLSSGNPFGPTAETGDYFVDLSGYKDQQPYFGVKQNIATTAGVTYALSFYLGVDNGKAIYSGPIGVTVTAAAVTKTIEAVSPSGTGNQWVLETVDFTATGPVSTIAIQGAQGDEYIGLDNVSVVQTGTNAPATNLIVNGDFAEPSINPAGVIATAGTAASTFNGIDPYNNGLVWTEQALAFTATSTRTAIGIQADAGTGFVGLGDVAVTPGTIDTFNPNVGTLWSTSANWSPSAPSSYSSGDIITNGIGTDDIPNPAPATLTLGSSISQLFVDDYLNIGNLAFAPSSFASASEVLEAQNGAIATISGSVTASRDANQPDGAGILLIADGSGSAIDDNALDDPGLGYEAASGGMIELGSTPSSNSTFTFVSPGTIAFYDPAPITAAPLEGVAPGDVLELPGTSVTGVTFSLGTLGSLDGTLDVTTNAGNYRFSDVQYLSAVSNYTTSSVLGSDLVAVSLTGYTFSDVDAYTDGLYYWSFSENWSDGVPPNGAAVTMDGNGTDNISESLTSLTVEGSFVLTVAAIVTVTTLTVENLVVPVSGTLTANGSISPVMASVSGGTWTQNGEIVVGQTATATVSISNGGVLSAQGIDEAQAAGSNGAVTVTGAKTELSVGNPFTIGDAGLGSLAIDSGGSVSTAGVVTIANQAAASGSSASVNDATWKIANTVYVGLAGSGRLDATNNATITTDALDAGFSAGGSGVVTLSNTDTHLYDSGNLTIGDAGSGELSVLNVSTVTANALTVGSQANSNGNVAVSGDSYLTVTGNVTVGAAGSGAVTEDNGGVITAASLDIGSSEAGSGVVDVNGAPFGDYSLLRVTKDVNVGDAGTGALSVTNGAALSTATLDAGVDASGTGVITVSGTDTLLTATGTVSIGGLGAGQLSILDGASVTVDGDLDAGALGGTGNVDVENASLTVHGNFDLGSYATDGDAIFTVGPEATVTIDGVIGYPFGFFDTPPGNAVLNQFAPIDPAALIGVTVNLNFNGTQTYSEEVEDSTINIGQGKTVTVETPTIFGGSTVNLGTSTDTKAATLVLNVGSVSSDSSIVFNNTIDTLAIGVNALGDDAPSLPTFKANIVGFQAGDKIAVDVGQGATTTVSGDMLTLTQNGKTLGSLTFSNAAAAAAASTAVTDQALCFLAGTLITTPSGQVPVERLAVGDMVVTAGGRRRPITWIGQGRVLATRGRRGAATPVIVRKGALGPNTPFRDLLVTKGHSLLLDDVLIPVEFLVNHRTILWDDHAQEVTIYHIELETHDVLLANGAAAESYRDDGNRWLFRNANSGWGQPPKPACAPVLTGGPIVDAVWRRLLDAAGPRPALALTDDADLHLVVDGASLDPCGFDRDIHVFTLPGTPSDVRLVSRAAAPQELGLARDPRLLGVAVRRIVVRQGSRFRVIKADDALLTEGFHTFEKRAGVRWTNGQAVLPPAMFAGFDGKLELVVQLGGATRYPDWMEARQVA